MLWTTKFLVLNWKINEMATVATTILMKWIEWKWRRWSFIWHCIEMSQSNCHLKKNWMENYEIKSFSKESAIWLANKCPTCNWPLLILLSLLFFAFMKTKIKKFFSVRSKNIWFIENSVNIHPQGTPLKLYQANSFEYNWLRLLKCR